MKNSRIMFLLLILIQAFSVSKAVPYFVEPGLKIDISDYSRGSQFLIRSPGYGTCSYSNDLNQRFRFVVSSAMKHIYN